MFGSKVLHHPTHDSCRCLRLGQTGIERDLKKSKLLLNCVLIITDVVPPELPMKLTCRQYLARSAVQVWYVNPFTNRMRTNKSIAIFCTESFRIPFAGRVDVCCFDKTGTITVENSVLEGVAGVE